MSRAISIASSASNTPARAPRSPRPPSARDLEIFKRVRLKGIEQWEVAVDLGIHKSRVSRIVTRVTRWLAAGGDPIDPLIRDHVARTNLARSDLKLRLARAIELASIALEFHPPLTTTRRRFQGTTEVWREEIERNVGRNNPSALRMLIDAIQSLQQLEQDDARGHSPTPPASDSDLLRAVFDFLCGWRSRAETNGLVPIAENTPALIADTLTTTLGLPTDHFARWLPKAATEPSSCCRSAPIEHLPAPNGQLPVVNGQPPGKLPLSASEPIDVNHNTSTPSKLQSEKTPFAVAFSNGQSGL